jgi:hypothetical protein
MCNGATHNHTGRCALLRARDRAVVGIAHYPKLLYPELYVLKGGYRAFFAEFPDLCEPRAYVTMADPRFAAKGANRPLVNPFGKAVGSNVCCRRPL